MKKNNYAKRRRPVEKHNTAAWANIEDEQPVSRIPIPNEQEVINAKEYVDENEK